MSLAALANLVGTLGIEATSAAKKKNKKQVLVNQLIDHFLLNPSANFIGMIEAANAPVVDSSASSIPRFDLLPGQAKHGKTKLPPQTSGHNPLIPTNPPAAAILLLRARFQALSSPPSHLPCSSRRHLPPMCFVPIRRHARRACKRLEVSFNKLLRRGQSHHSRMLMPPLPPRKRT